MPVNDRNPIDALKAFLGRMRNPSAARRAAKALAPHIMEIRSRLLRARKAGHGVELSGPLDRLLFGA